MAGSRLCIFLCGGHSTGKTTILKDLLPHVNIKPELDVARGVMQQLGVSRSDINPQTNPEKFEKLQLHILTRLLEIDNEHSTNGIDWICDRGIDPVVYAEVYLGPETAKRLLQTDVAQRFLQRLRSAEIFVVTPHEQCIADDGVRLSMPSMDELQRFTDVMRSLLDQHSIAHHVISVVDRRDRVEQIVGVVRSKKPSILRQHDADDVLTG